MVYFSAFFPSFKSTITPISAGWRLDSPWGMWQGCRGSPLESTRNSGGRWPASVFCSQFGHLSTCICGLPGRGSKIRTVRFLTYLLAALIGLSSFQMAQARPPKPHHPKSVHAKGVHESSTKVTKHKVVKYKTPQGKYRGAKYKKPKAAKWGPKR